MLNMNGWELIAALAVVVQLVTEGVARMYPKKTVYVAGAVGVLVAILTQTGILGALGATVRWPVVDQILTGILLAGGAKIVNILLEYVRSKTAR